MKVELVRWPADGERRQRLETEGVPRILVVEGDADAPGTCHRLEDWVRPPISRRDLQARKSTLVARALADVVPFVDDDVLVFGPQRLCLSPTEAQLMQVLCAEFSRVVDRATLVEQMWLGASEHDRRNALDLRVMRLRRRVTPLRLTIRTAWGRGYLLEDDRLRITAAERSAG